jgi:type II secretory pathway pseudopilin PulG
MSRPHAQRGMSAVEALIAMVVSTLLLTGALGLLIGLRGSQRRAAAAAEIDETQRLALVVLQDELRRAGDGHPGAERVIQAEAQRLSLQGAAGGRAVATSFYADEGTLYRRRGRTTQPLADGIDALRFEYFDDRGLLLPPPLMRPQDRERICAVRVQVEHRQPARLASLLVVLRRPAP